MYTDYNKIYYIKGHTKLMSGQRVGVKRSLERRDKKETTNVNLLTIFLVLRHNLKMRGSKDLKIVIFSCYPLCMDPKNHRLITKPENKAKLIKYIFFLNVLMRI